MKSHFLSIKIDSQPALFLRGILKGVSVETPRNLSRSAETSRNPSRSATAECHGVAHLAT